MQREMEALFRRVQMLATRSRVTLVDDSGPVQIVQARTSALEIADKRVRVQEYGFTSNPPTDSDAVLLSLTGDRSGGVIVGTNHQGSRPRNLKPGETKLYCLDGKFIYLTAGGGIIVDAAGQNVVVQNANNVTWTLSGKLTISAPGGIEFDAPMVKSSGDMQDNFASNPHTMAAMRTIYDSHNHVVQNVQGGTSSVTSNTPTQQE